MAEISKTSYDNARYGVVHRTFTVPLTKIDVATVGTLLEAFLTLPEKAKIIRFGIQSAASDCVFAASDTF